MKRHCVKIHSCEYIVLGAIVEKSGANVEKTGAIVEKTGAIVENCGAIVEVFSCTTCGKEYKNKRYLNSHMTNCKGVLNPLECHICHKVFNTRSAKSKHCVKCTSQALILSPPQETSTAEPVSTPKISHINNSTVNTGTMNSHNNTVNNIIIACNPGSGDMIEFITNHITNPELKELIAPIINSQRCTPEMVETYTRHLLTNPENRCIEKTNLRSIHSKVHVGNNKWQTKHDKEVLPYYATSVANNMDITLKERLEDDKTLVDRRTLKAIEKYLDYMSEKGYCNDEALGKQMQQEFYEIKHRLKAVIYDTTVDTTVEPPPQTEAAEVKLPKSDITD